MTTREIAMGWPYGVSAGAAAAAGSSTTPRAVLEARFRELLGGTPLYVAFSGGRDSAALLALATHVARREGLPLPVPLTLHYPHAEGTWETDWQELVLGHLGLEGHRIDVPAEADVVGPDVVPLLQRYGVCWPPGMYNRLPLFGPARGGALVTGEGGDEVLGPRRITPLVQLARRRFRWPTLPQLRAVGRALAPAAVRRRLGAGGGLWPGEWEWLREPLRSEVVAAGRDDDAHEPLRHDRATRYWVERRAMVVGQRNQDRLAAHHGVDLVHPLMEPAFVRSLEVLGGRFGRGWVSRTELLRLLVGDLLPDAVVTRTGKTSFNGAVFGASARAFAERWDGSGVPADLVDPERLRQEWLRPVPHAATLALLQSARLAEAER